MPAFSASAPGKIILFGEHAVVYGQPALAVPVLQVKARAIITFNPRGTPGAVKLQAADIGLETWLSDLPENHPLAAVLHKAASAMNLHHIPACTIQIASNIPIAGGMGSGAAVSVAILRAFSGSLGHLFSDEEVSQLAYEVEVIHHGTPSGIDNTVITYAKPVYFVKGKPIETIHVHRSFSLLIGDTGIQSSTANAVGDVRQAWENSPQQYEVLFDSIGKITARARYAIESGENNSLGPLMNENHDLLQELGVSSHKLDMLVVAARSAGALGAKLSGAGRGGSMIALVNPDASRAVTEALEQAGATRTILTEVHET